MDQISMDVLGYNHRQVPNSMFRHGKPVNHLGIILPGYRHTADMPDLYYAGRILLAKGADVLRVDYAYDKTDFMEKTEQEQADWLNADVKAACEAALKKRSYGKITIIGKSLGSLAMGHLLNEKAMETFHCVWSTPLLTNDWLCSQIMKYHPRSLFIIGTEDKFYHPVILDELVRGTHGKAVVLNGVNHGLEIPNDILGTLDALAQIVKAVLEFIE